MKNLIKRNIPTKDYIKEHPQLRFLSKYIHHADFWHMNEKSVANALLVGLFCAALPIPGQMILAIVLGIPFRANLLLCVSLALVSNPFTMAPIAFASYSLGRLILDSEPISFQSVHYFFTHLDLIWMPFLLGSVMLGLISGGIGYALTRIFWRIRNLR
jgi:uncharacterized protein (DUF2062 family)